MIKLWATSDLHVSHDANRAFVTELSSRPDDWLIVAGDVCEREADLAWTLDALAERFAKLFWVPGNHELWTMAPGEARGVEKYERLVALCRERGVHTPEDPYVEWPGAEHGTPATYIAPLFLLYDYSFRPGDVPRERALAWAREAGLRCADEHFLHPDPYRTRDEWCAARLSYTRERLEALGDVAFVLVNHFPLRVRDVILPLIPRFSIWCGTAETEDWATRYRARAVVYGHLHVRRRTSEGACTFHEVSLGYPPQWDGPADAQLRRVL